MKNTKSLLSGLLILIFSLSIVSCGGKKTSKTESNQLGRMEVVIPDELKENKEIVTYIEGMSELVDDYALLLDDMIKDLDGYHGKDWEDLSIREQLKLTKTGAQFAMKAAPITAKWREFEIKKGTLEGDLSEEELMALETIMKRFEKRMEEIEARNQDFFGQAEG